MEVRMDELIDELVGRERSIAREHEASETIAFCGFAAPCSSVRSANVLAILLVRSMELCGAYAFVLSTAGHQMGWSLRTLLRRHNQDQLEVVRLLVGRLRARGGSKLILRSQLEGEAWTLEPLPGQSSGVGDALTDIVQAHRELTLRAQLFEREFSGLGDAETAELIHRHVFRRNRRAGWLLSVRMAAVQNDPLH